MKLGLKGKEDCSMKSGKTLIATASWEDRYLMGVRESVQAGGIDNVVILFSSRYSTDTNFKTEQLREVCQSAGINFEQTGFDFENQVATLRTVEAVVGSALVRDAEEIVFDISTTPRPVLWSILDALGRSRDKVTIRYYPGQSYGDWQTDEEGEPRLVLRRSGIMYPDQPTALILLCGPEISRAEKMCFQFEPRIVHILRDPRAEQYGVVKHLSPEYRSISTEIAFDNKDISDSNYQKLDHLAADLLNPQAPSNVVVAALGPKLGALLLFRLSRERPEVGLGYVVSGKHNPTSTVGLGARTDIELCLDIAHT